MKTLMCFSFRILCLLGAITSLIVTPARASDYTMGGTFPVNQLPVALVTGDFNRDGRLDLAVANQGSADVSILLGNGDGTFQAASNYLAGDNPQAIAIGDFNRDGKLDLAVVNQTDPGTVSILLGNGDGTFQGGVSYGTGVDPSSVAISDFNADGKLDLAVGNGSDPISVSVLLGNGDGTFGTAVNYNTVANSLNPVSGPAVVCGYFDSDKKIDIAVADPVFSGKMSVLLGNGNGTFKTAVNYPTGRNPTSLRLGDFNGDGIMDAVTFNSASVGSASILLGNGNGTFQNGVGYNTGATLYIVGDSLAVTDYGHDGALDLAVIKDSGLAVLRGFGDGSFDSPDTYSVDPNAVALVAGDFNHDRKPDLAIANYSNPGSVSIMLNTSPGIDLAIVRSNNTAIVSWVYPSTGYILESRNSFSSGNWQPVPESQVTNDGFWQVQVNVTAQPRFFRLRQQP